MSKKFVLSGYYGFKNFGDEAILSVLVNKLKKQNGKITVISIDPKYTKSQYPGVNSIYTFDITYILRTIFNSDYLISGGGSLLQDATSIKSLAYYLLIILIGFIFQKKVIIFAQGIGPIKNPIALFITMHILKHCHYVSVRDKKSQALLKFWGVKSELLCDPIFSTEISHKDKKDIVAIQLRNCKGMNNDFIDRLAQSVSLNFPNYKIEIFSFQDEIDLDVCRNFEKNLKLLNPDIDCRVYYELNNQQVIEHLAEVEYLIGMRFHALIIAILAKVKTLAINYDPKVEKIAKEFKLPLLNLTKEFTNQFELVKLQKTEEIQEKVKNKNFNWSGFDKAIGD